MINQVKQHFVKIALPLTIILTVLTVTQILPQNILQDKQKCNTINTSEYTALENYSENYYNKSEICLPENITEKNLSRLNQTVGCIENENITSEEELEKCRQK